MPRPYRLPTARFSQAIAQNVFRLMAVCGLASCAPHATRVSEQFEQQASAAGLIRHVIQGNSFSHIVYERATVRKSHDPVLVYLEGDGSPSFDRVNPALDPSPRNPLALKLMTQTQHPAWYLTRPCYLSFYNETGCYGSLWTDARYSDQVVDSMVAALSRYGQTRDNPPLILIGYSGGGTLAVLMAPKLKNVVGVATVAANLDIVAWTTTRGYSPLTASRNPANEPPANITEVHFVGALDKNVPPASTDHYFVTHPDALLWSYDAFDHYCCWEKQWPTLLNRALNQMQSGK